MREIDYVHECMHAYRDVDVRACLQQQLDDLGPALSRRHMQRGDALLIVPVYIRS